MKEEPVRIVPYDPSWPSMFEAERMLLERALRDWCVGGIEHIGSTAVVGLCAKPVIDILCGVANLSDSLPAIEALQGLQYCYAPYKADVMHWFCKPSPYRRTHHLHLVPFQSPLWNERLAFRDRLRRDPNLARAYGDLKLALASEFEHDREAYTDAKTSFIRTALGDSLPL